MKADLTEAGFEELLSAQDVQTALERPGTTFLVINSVCGCAAGAARPAVKASLENDKTPDHLVTVFAGVDTDAVNAARERTTPYPPSSPSMALFQDGQLRHFIERHQIEGNTAETIADHLKKVYDHFC